MSDQHLPPAYIEPHYSSSCPANRAAHLYSLLKAVDHLVPEIGMTVHSPGQIGLPALLTVMIEMADDLCREIECLDERGWPIARAAVDANRPGK